MVGVFCKCLQSISHARKPSDRHQDFHSRLNKKKVSCPSNEDDRGGHLGFCHLDPFMNFFVGISFFAIVRTYEAKYD